MSPQVELVEVSGDREPFVSLLLEADESEPVLRTYLSTGELFEIVDAGSGGTVGVCLLIPEDGHVIELKAIAIAEVLRGKGFGRAAIVAIADHARSNGARRLIVGTADTSMRTIAFYRSAGFSDDGVRAGFFDAYPEPVIEDGRTAHDMMMFSMELDTPP